ncbi:MAG: hypothetical protein RIG63_07990 [Coleofasciculus chthonoplastes F3-SA18-01]
MQAGRPYTRIKSDSLPVCDRTSLSQFAPIPDQKRDRLKHTSILSQGGRELKIYHKHQN